MKLYPRSIRVNVVVVTAVATLLAAAAMGFTHYRVLEQRSESDLVRLLTLSASESASRVARWLQDRKDAAAGIAGSATLIDELRRIRHLAVEDDEYFLALFRLKRELDQNTLSQRFIYETTIHDAHSGAVFLASTGPEMELPAGKDDHRGLVEGRTHLWVSPLFTAAQLLPDESGKPAMGVPCMFIAAPIRDGEELLGVLRVRVRVLDIGENLLRAANYSDMYATSETYILNGEGLLLSPTHCEPDLRESGRIRQRAMLELQHRLPPVSAAATGTETSRRQGPSPQPDTTVNLRGYAGIGGHKAVGAWTPVANTDWLCVAEIDHAEAFAPLAALSRSTLYVSLTIVALVVGLSSWLAMRIVAPLQHVGEVASRLAAGDRSVRCRLQGKGEIVSLAHAFDHMADSNQETLIHLEKNAASLAETNRRLEAELSERHRAEQQLRTANAFLDSVIDNVPTMLFMKSADDLRMVRFNKAGEELVGLPRESLIGKTDFDIYPREEAEFFAAKDREVLRGMTMVEIDEEELLTENGLRILHTKKIPVCDEQGRAQYLLGISEDITEKKQTLEALKAAKEAAES
ncbi:MAG: PAS domain-containing protein, partial [Planctomycetales bacterium]|nr:PAS domain-containing protein [Planctomycetales bacterium]